MHNPFDKSFFKFLLGFTLILALSFTMLYFVGRQGVSVDNADLPALGPASAIDSVTDTSR